MSPATQGAANLSKKLDSLCEARRAELLLGGSRLQVMEGFLVVGGCWVGGCGAARGDEGTGRTGIDPSVAEQAASISRPSAGNARAARRCPAERNGNQEDSREVAAGTVIHDSQGSSQAAMLRGGIPVVTRLRGALAPRDTTRCSSPKRHRFCSRPSRSVEGYSVTGDEAGVFVSRGANTPHLFNSSRRSP